MPIRPRWEHARPKRQTPSAIRENRPGVDVLSNTRQPRAEPRPAGPRPVNSVHTKPRPPGEGPAHSARPSNPTAAKPRPTEARKAPPADPTRVPHDRQNQGHVRPRHVPNHRNPLPSEKRENHATVPTTSSALRDNTRLRAAAKNPISGINRSPRDREQPDPIPRKTRVHTTGSNPRHGISNRPGHTTQGSTAAPIPGTRPTAADRAHAAAPHLEARPDAHPLGAPGPTGGRGGHTTIHPIPAAAAATGALPTGPSRDPTRGHLVPRAVTRGDLRDPTPGPHVPRVVTPEDPPGPTQGRRDLRVVLRAVRLPGDLPRGRAHL